MKYQEFDVVYFNKIHEDLFFKNRSEKLNVYVLDKTSNVMQKKDDLTKIRPAIIFRKIFADELIYCILPLTTKKKDNIEKFRSEFILSEKDNNACWIMWDDIKFIKETSIIGLFTDSDNKFIRVSGAKKNWIKSQFILRLNYLFGININEK